MTIPDFMKTTITNDYIKSFLKSKQLPYSNTNKMELINTFEGLVSKGGLTIQEEKEFLARYFKYGVNRTIVTNIIGFNLTNAITSKESLEKKLSSLKEPTGYFNKIDEISETNDSEDTLFYQSIAYRDDGSTNMIERGFYRDERVVATDEDGTPIYGNKKIFTWIVLDVVHKTFNVHTRDIEPNYFGQNVSFRRTNEKFLNIHKKMFGFTVSSALNEERTLYNIYKEMTEKAEAPFKEKVTDEIKEKISGLFLEVSDLIGYNKDNDGLKMPNRISRLFERGLINQNYDLYSMYEDGKVGIIKRIVFYDSTGANVSAMVKEISENISSYDIYFDTRDTLDERKSLNKLWAFWYFRSSIDSKEEKYEVKMEVENDYYITHFLRRSVLEEVAEYVFSRFREFENFNTN